MGEGVSVEVGDESGVGVCEGVSEGVRVAVVLGSRVNVAVGVGICVCVEVGVGEVKIAAMRLNPNWFWPQNHHPPARKTANPKNANSKAPVFFLAFDGLK